MRKIKIISVIIIFTILIFIDNALSLTASIGNSRMTLRIGPGENVEKYILIKNVNDVNVKITLEASGDLKDNIIFKETEINLKPGEEKKAYFTIKSEEEGTTESKINIGFVPEEGNSVGLSSTIIAISKGEYAGNQETVYEYTSIKENKSSEDQETKDTETESTEEDNSGLDAKSSFSELLNNNSKYLIYLMFVLVAILVILYFLNLGVNAGRRKAMVDKKPMDTDIKVEESVTEGNA